MEQILSKYFREPVSGLTHAAGACLSIAALVVMVVYACTEGTVWHIVSFSIFGACLILLYTASSLYHMLPVSDKWILRLRRMDHMMIFVLIAGTYTPICLVPLRGGWGWSLFGIIWGLAILGILLKIFWMKAPRIISTLFYVLMGWIVVIAMVPLLSYMPITGIIWLGAGGLLYTAGAVLYALKIPQKKILGFGFHEIFHLFVIAGSFAHFWMIFKYILPLA